MNNFMMVSIKADTHLSPDCILISPDLSGYARYVHNQKVKLGIGQSSRTVKIRIGASKTDKKSLTMNPALLKKSYLSENTQYGVKMSPDEIRIGPVIGIMAPRRASKNRPFSGQTTFFQELITSGRKLGEICYAFYFNDIDWNHKIVNGYFPTTKGWKSSKFPLPDVIYPRSKFWAASGARSRNRLNRLGVKVLNPPMVGKWELHCFLKKNPELAPYLPETRSINSFGQVGAMLKKYRAVYLKPVNGTKGKNIIRVSRSKKTSGYCYQYHTNGKLHKRCTSDLSSLQKQLRPIMGGRRYLVQKEIDLLRYQGGIVDIRVMVQKGHNGKWKVTGMACRVGKQGSITSNISSGGRGQKVETVLNQNFSDPKLVDQITETIAFVAITAAQGVEDYRGNCGEIGVDIGVDKNGKVWFIEANLRPARLVFSLIGEKQTRLKSVETPLLYARYLAGF
jgi:glutathione synthase/RimK-type ligase-like ATP-grasp enzyme